ncbi:MAG: addiction module toxin, HicA family [Cyanobacteria bacterium RI_101]|nr:addiction module toxin, HicA family [Cyanobacteria bacterium RI_101]
MKLPRDLSGKDLAKKLKVLGYEISHQSGSHIRLTTQSSGEHHITVPAHNPLKIGTLNNILRNISEHFGISRNEVLKRIF